MGSKKIQIVFNSSIDFTKLGGGEKIASIQKGLKEIIPVYYSKNFQQNTNPLLLSGKGHGVFSFFGIVKETQKPEVLVDDLFIEVYNKGKVDICEGILAHEYGHYVDDCHGTRHMDDYECRLKADFTADKYGAEATTKKILIESIKYVREYFAGLNNRNYAASIKMLDERLARLEK